ncbi:hypothetical protein HYH03_010704 [Edaphochlamys debaryana]|uniref:BZIP domain-containing protein n=1 Tax=Edaphochlamys debaryana TaxID=47281 RepID=A0A836BVM1_9CHLO|nr:hypothetical protein HYH03_010704 [Edaphochlamys debaryana]|eukprot:KAG2490781.1 hypothetical protein HYH03_010704 [Edaphochlamys debaryana]
MELAPSHEHRSRASAGPLALLAGAATGYTDEEAEGAWATAMAQGVEELEGEGAEEEAGGGCPYSPDGAELEVDSGSSHGGSGCGMGMGAGGATAAGCALAAALLAVRRGSGSGGGGRRGRRGAAAAGTDGTDDGGGGGGSPADSAELRRERNRLAAKRCRERKQQALAAMEGALGQAQAANEQLAGHVEELVALYQQVAWGKGGGVLGVVWGSWGRG